MLGCRNRLSIYLPVSINSDTIQITSRGRSRSAAPLPPGWGCPWPGGEPLPGRSHACPLPARRHEFGGRSLASAGPRARHCRAPARSEAGTWHGVGDTRAQPAPGLRGPRETSPSRVPAWAMPLVFVPSGRAPAPLNARFPLFHRVANEKMRMGSFSLLFLPTRGRGTACGTGSGASP